MVLPSFKEDYNGKEMIDIHGTICEDLIFEHIPINISKSSIELDEDGMFKANINLGAQIVVEEEPGNWTAAREIYMTLTAHLKFSVNETVNRTSGESMGKYLIIAPKRLEMSMFKIYKEEEEQILEQ